MSNNNNVIEEVKEALKEKYPEMKFTQLIENTKKYLIDEMIKNLSMN